MQHQSEKDLSATGTENPSLPSGSVLGGNKTSSPQKSGADFDNTEEPVNVRRQRQDYFTGWEGVHHSHKK